MQGIPAGFALTALANYLAAENVSTGDIGAFVALIGFPWGIKFIWGPIVDRFSYRSMGNRRPWIIATQLASLLTMTGIFLVGDPTSNLNTLSLLFCIHAIFASIQDVAVDALAIEIVPKNERGKTTAFMRSGMVVGTAIGAAGLGYLLSTFGFGWAAATEAVLLGMLTFISFFIRERPGDRLLPSLGKTGKVDGAKKKKLNFRFIYKQLVKGIFQRTSILLTLAISIIYIAESLYRRVLDVHLIQNLGWTDIELNSLKGVAGTVLTLLIVFIGGWFVDRYGVRSVLRTTILLLFILIIGYTALESYWSDQWLTSAFLLVKSSADALVNVSAIPLFMYLARRGVEGSQFVFYMALSNQMDVVGASLAGVATTYTTMAELGWICSGGVIVAFIIISFSGKLTQNF